MFTYSWDHQEANFGKPLKNQVKGGTHISLEIIPKYKGQYVAFRRSSIPRHEQPAKGAQLLYFCHDLIRRGESLEKCISRVVKAQTGAAIKSYRVVDIDSSIQKKDGQWAIVPHIIAELTTLPRPGYFGNEITEAVTFTQKQVPDDLAWWSRKELQDFLKTFDIPL